MNRNMLLAVVLIGWLIAGGIFAQLQQSGGPGSAVTATQSGTWNINNISGTVSLPTGASTSAKQPALGTAGSASADVISVQGIASMTALKVDPSGVTSPVSLASLPALATGANMIGYFKLRPNGCTTALTSEVVHDTVQVTTGAGSSVSSVTGCVEECYVNNITNSAVTLRIADKSGTPVIWVGGNGDFSVPANSNMGCGADGGLMLAGITFTSGITAIAGTASALNLHIVTRE